jgi:hypothetical protein
MPAGRIRSAGLSWLLGDNRASEQRRSKAHFGAGGQAGAEARGARQVPTEAGGSAADRTRKDSHERSRMSRGSERETTSRHFRLGRFRNRLLGFFAFFVASAAVLVLWTSRPLKIDDLAAVAVMFAIAAVALAYCRWMAAHVEISDEALVYFRRGTRKELLWRTLSHAEWGRLTFEAGAPHTAVAASLAAKASDNWVLRLEGRDSTGEPVAILLQGTDFFEHEAAIEFLEARTAEFNLRQDSAQVR